MNLTYSQAKQEAAARHGADTSRYRDFMIGWQRDAMRGSAAHNKPRHGASRRHKRRNGA
ncbi:hypothetical protein [Desulfovibrio falkowii]|uniref:Uncharacterized protein n=1 Tax=Desulfovibrio falkowii TaxID=3136602 RepID=A0ABQ0E9R1_9BACT